MFPAQSLAEEMLSRGWRVALMSDDRGLRYSEGFPESVARIQIGSATFARGGLVARLLVLPKILAGRYRHAGLSLKTNPRLLWGSAGIRPFLRYWRADGRESPALSTSKTPCWGGSIGGLLQR